MNITPFKRTQISRSVRSVLIGSSAALALSAGGAAVAADSKDIEVLRDQVRMLMERIDELEQQQAVSDEKVTAQEERLSEVREQVETAPANIVTAGDTPGSFKIPGTDTSVSISGYVKGDLIYDLDADVGDSFSVGAIPNDGVSTKDNVRLHARQSRLRVGTNTDVGNGSTINTLIEGDFFGSGGNELFSNSSGFRIRHAFGEYNTPGGSFLAGQTWTLFGGFNYAPTVDFFAPNGQTFLRQGQVRWTLPNGFAIGLENPETFFGFGQTAESVDELPDLVAKWSGGPGGAAGDYSISGVVRQVGGIGTGIDGAAFDDTTTAWGLHVGGTWDFDSVMFTAGAALGDGLGRYHLANTSAGVVGVGGELETIDQYGVTAGLSFRTTETSSVNFSLGYSERDDEFAALTPTADENGLSLHANYMWNPWPGTNFGVEVIHGQREQFDGVEGDATRLQFGAQRSF
jgi:hypothetical protein